MNASLIAVLGDDERLLVAETEPPVLATLDEDAAIALESRVRRARNKYVGQYRRAAAARVAAKRSRGTARPENKRAAMKVEVFELALSRVSRRVSVLARESAAALRAERLDAAQTAKRAQPRPRTRPRAATTVSGPGKKTPAGDRSLRSPASETRRAHTRAIGDRRQGKKDNRGG
jgi:hypothetical protein